MVGAFPPQSQGIQDYCREIAEGIGAHTSIHAVGFRAMYPSFLFPGVRQAMDPTKAPPAAPYLTTEHRLAWYNPLGWVVRALTMRADVLHVQWWSLPLWPVMMTFAVIARLRSIPIAVTVHNVLPHERSRLFVPATRALCWLAHGVFVHSHVNGRQLRDRYGVAPERIEVVPMPVTCANVKPDNARSARATLGVPAGVPLVLFFGTIRPYKGLHGLITAFAKLRETEPEAHLVVAGKPWEPWAPYEQQIESAGLGDHVLTFTDYVPEEEVNTLLSAADCFVLPYTHFDAQSAVGARYLPYGRPLIVTDVGGLPEWVNHDPRFIVPPEDTDALAKALVEVIASLPDATAWFAQWSREALRTMHPEAVGALMTTHYSGLTRR
jgi:glycosyltransferase involved in cell wall biosynthesis